MIKKILALTLTFILFATPLMKLDAQVKSINSQLDYVNGKLDEINSSLKN
ncbi:MAG: hypothetical protein RSG52_15870 [Terrisporobacter sp.]